MYKLWCQSSCSTHCYNFIRQLVTCTLVPKCYCMYRMCYVVSLYCLVVTISYSHNRGAVTSTPIFMLIYSSFCSAHSIKQYPCSQALTQLPVACSMLNCTASDGKLRAWNANITAHTGSCEMVFVRVNVDVVDSVTPATSVWY